MRAQWVCSRERRIALYKRSSIKHFFSSVHKLPLRKSLVRKLSTSSSCWGVQSASMTLVFIISQLAFVTVPSPRLLAARLTRLTIVSRLLMPVTQIFSISCSSSVSGRSTTTTATRVATSGCRCSVTQRDANVHTRTVNQSKGNRHWARLQYTRI